VAEFAPALKALLVTEGGLVDDPKDPGGITNSGISLRFLRELGAKLGDIDHDGDVDADDIRQMSADKAAPIYRSQWWDRYGYGQLVDQEVATKVLSEAVNLGPRVAHKLAQGAAGRCGCRCKIDGLWGPQTAQAVNDSGKPFLPTYRGLLEAHYRLIVSLHPELRKFLNGWVKRARS
jgi:lysozyme family protein